MQSKKLHPCGALAVGSLIVVTGIGFAAMYVLEAIVARIGEPDRSLLFWYLPILLMGIMGIIIGLSIGIWGAFRLRRIRQEDAPREN